MRQTKLSMATASPLLTQLRGRPFEDWTDDAVAGLITAILLIPQGMAYALLAGMPAQHGLYAAIIPTLFYAFLGSSATLAVGPVAVAALMVNEALVEFTQADPSLWLPGAMLLAFIGGVAMFGMGLLKAGKVVRFISHPVLQGFTSAAAILIIVSQLPGLLGADVGHGDFAHTLTALFENLGAINPVVLAIGLLSITLLWTAKKYLPDLLVGAGFSRHLSMLLSRLMPAALVLIGTLCSAAFLLAESYGVAIVGSIPRGLPQPRADFLLLEGAESLIMPALLIALIGYVESVSIAKVLAARRREVISPNRELIALGVANVGSAFSGTIPVAGGFSRSAVNYDAGAKTQFAAVITACLVGLAAILLTGLLTDLPKVILSAIIVVAVSQLIHVGRVRELWEYDRSDAAAFVITFFGVLLAGIENGLLLGLLLSLGQFIWRTSEPHIAVIGRIRGTEHFRNVNRHAVDVYPCVLMMRVDESLYFANITSVETCIAQKLSDQPEARHLLLMFVAVNRVDTTALEALIQLADDLHGYGMKLHLTDVKGPVMDRLKGTDLIGHPACTVDLSAHEALNHILEEEGISNENETK